MTLFFDSTPARASACPFPLHAGDKSRLKIKLPEAPPAEVFSDVLSVVVDDGSSGTLWRRAIPVMRFTLSLLGRASVPLMNISGTTPQSPSASLEPGNTRACRTRAGWNPDLQDVVVWLPNGGRFVFWRGSSYIPFWAGLHNTGACYEWAEIISQPSGAVDCVEPLMDKELRVQPGRDRRIDDRPRPRALDVPVDRFRLQGLGRPGR